MKQVIIVIFYISIFSHGFVYDIHGVTVNSARISSVVLSIFLAFHIFISGKYRKHDALFRLLLCWLSVSFLSSSISVDPRFTLNGFLVIVSSVLFYVFVWQFKFTYRLNRDYRLLNLIGFVLGMGGMIVFISGITGIGFSTLNRLFLEFHHDEIRVRMTMLEPNLYGAVMLWFCLFAVATFDKKQKILSSLVLFATHVGLLISFSRGPWVGYLFAIIIYFVVTRPACYKISDKKIAVCFLLMCIVLLFCMSPDAKDTFFEDRLSMTFDRTSSINARMLIYKLAWPDILEHPIIGNGVFSFAALHPYSNFLLGTTAEGTRWISQMFYAILHDSGIIGLVCIVLFFYLLFLRSYQSVVRYKGVNGVDEKLKLASALLASAFGVLMASQITTAHSLAFFWVVMAFANELPYLLYVSDHEVESPAVSFGSGS